MRAFLYEFDSFGDALPLEKLVELAKQCRFVFVEEFLSLEVLIGRDHDVVEVAVGDFEVAEAADVAFR